MKLNAYDDFLISAVMPDIKKALKKEESLFRKRIDNSLHGMFYTYDDRSIASTLFTERTIQYILFRELCVNYKIWPESLSYGKSLERLDLSIYKNIADFEKEGEIGIELKWVQFTKENELRSKSFKKVVGDFVKIKRVKSKNKYLLLMGLTVGKLDTVKFDQDFLDFEDNKKFKKYRLKTIVVESFKSLVGEKSMLVNMILVKLVHKNMEKRLCLYE